MDNSIVADGPGTGIFAIEKDSVLCLIRHDKPAYLDSPGNIVQSEYADYYGPVQAEIIVWRQQKVDRLR